MTFKLTSHVLQFATLTTRGHSLKILSVHNRDDFLIFPGDLLGSSHRIQTFLGEGGSGYVATSEDTQNRNCSSVMTLIIQQSCSAQTEASEESVITQSPSVCVGLEPSQSLLYTTQI
ncbi:homeodomain-interacting protein kinase 2-like protein [Lates japonicus]|uniref:Homeodomain-interacting protein kinase 2-like protein n=1 Tax=Lates japonicus TaxID=270547 RepID=A0AAD3MHZ1_LATJO|nr:homeodomain-interacting protein kinase 2-like protein [Lates japonicus]